MRNVSKRCGALGACLAVTVLAFVPAVIATFGGPPWP
jgi:hypothetical protein